MKALLRAALAAACAGALLAGSAFEAQAITCETRAPGRQGAFYAGLSASFAYDSKFSRGPAVPGLATHVPQGIAAWHNWDGARDLLLVTAYRDGADAHIIGIDPATGEHVGTVAIAESHVGGIAVTKGWAFVSGASDSIRKYRLSELRAKMKEAGTPYLKQVGTARQVYAASFISSYGEYLYAGKFNEGGRDKMYRYKVNDDGSLTTQTGAYEVPTKTQGLMVTADKFVYSTSFGNDDRSNIYVVERGARDIDRPSTHCFRAPSMSQGITEYSGHAYLLFESGAAKYVAKNPRNIVRNLHKSKISTLVRF